MFFKSLDSNDQKVIINAFITDGFQVRPIERGIIAEKNGEKIIITRLDSAKLVLNLKHYLSKRGLLSNYIGGIDFNTILKFVRNEKKLKESYIDCLKRVCLKFNWAAMNSGELELSGELKDAVGERASFLEIETDQGQMITILGVVDDLDNEKIFATNQRIFKVLRQLNDFDQIEAFKELAPKAYLTLRQIVY